MNALEKGLHERALAVARRYRHSENKLLEILERLDDKKVYRAFGYSSLFQYAVRELKLSEETAYSFIAVLRKAREIPAIKTAIASGDVCVANVRKLLKVISNDSAKIWLERAKNLPKEKLEREIARVDPKFLTPERVYYVNADWLQLQVGIDEELHQRLLRVKDLLSQKLKRAATMEDALRSMSDLFIRRFDILEKKPRSKVVHDISPAPVLRRVPLPSAVRHFVYMRDSGQCVFVDSNGVRCRSRRWLDVHHVVPVAEGGTNAVENLRLVCGEHHRGLHLCVAN